MKKNMIQVMMLFLIVGVFLVSGYTVNAQSEETYYVNNNGVALTKAEFDKLSLVFHPYV